MRRILCLFLAISVLLSLLCGTTFAQSTENITIETVRFSYWEENGTVNEDWIRVTVKYTATGVTSASLTLTPIGAPFDFLWMGQEDELSAEGTFSFGVAASKFVEGATYTVRLASKSEAVATKNIVYRTPGTEHAEVDLTTINGAQMRLTGQQGLRFISNIKKSGDFGAVKEYGTVIIPTENLVNMEDLKIDAEFDGRKVAKVPAVYRYAEDETHITFTAVVVNISEQNYTRSYTVRAYAILEDDTVIYGDTFASRSLYQVAKRILENESATDTETEAAQKIVDAVETRNDNETDS